MLCRLSTSSIVAFEQCAKRAWLKTHRSEVAGIDTDAGPRLAASQAVRELAYSQCVSAVRIQPDPITTPLAVTHALLARGHDGPVIGAQFEHRGVRVRIDLLEPHEAGWQIVEVKSSTKAKPEHEAVLATKLWVARGAGVAITGVTIRHIDREFVLDQPLGHVGLFADVDLTSRLFEAVASRETIAAAALEAMAGPEPDVPMGDQCTKPFPCAFAAYCEKDHPTGPKWPVTLLPRGAGKRFLAEGIEDLTLIDPAALSSDMHRRIHGATVTGVTDHDPMGAAAAMAPWTYPRIWLDFETVSDAIPIWRGCAPYDQVPFQFVADVETANGVVERRDFLALDGADPRRSCAEALAALPDKGAVIAWNASFERGVIQRLAASFPDLAPTLQNLADRVVDLLPVTRDHWYHRDQRGSWSIKAVLPTIAPHLDYGALDVKDGGNAVEAYRAAVADDCTTARRAALASALRIYCGRDVEAMRIVAAKLVQTDVHPG